VRAAHRSLRPGGKFFYVTPDRNFYCWLSFVLIGPRWVFGLHRSNHDYLRFPKPHELDRLLEGAGFRVDEDPQRPGHKLHRGVEYTTRFSPITIRESVRARELRGIALELVPPRRWMKGFLGEYLGTATRL
jgi:hypothetical protein